jgi:hypothetical protein
METHSANSKDSRRRAKHGDNFAVNVLAAVPSDEPLPGHALYTDELPHLFLFQGITLCEFMLDNLTRVVF